MNDSNKEDVFIDLAGLKCPLPVLRTKKALSMMEPGQVLKVHTTDPSSAKDIPAFAQLSKHELLGTETVEDGHLFFLRSMSETAKIGLLSVSDRASKGDYADEGLPGLRDWLTKALVSDWEAVERLIPDEQGLIEETLKDLTDNMGCCLVLTTGGTGPAIRDVTPDATMAVADRIMDGFGERMRAHSLKYAPTAILSRQVAVVRGKCLIINLPGRPKAIAETLEDVFSAVPYCIDLLEGPYLETDPNVVVAFRPAGKAQGK